MSRESISHYSSPVSRPSPSLHFGWSGGAADKDVPLSPAHWTLSHSTWVIYVSVLTAACWTLIVLSLLVRLDFFFMWLLTACVSFMVHWYYYLTLLSCFSADISLYCEIFFVILDFNLLSVMKIINIFHTFTRLLFCLWYFNNEHIFCVTQFNLAKLSIWDFVKSITQI